MSEEQKEVEQKPEEEFSSSSDDSSDTGSSDTGSSSSGTVEEEGNDEPAAIKKEIPQDEGIEKPSGNQEQHETEEETGHDKEQGDAREEAQDDASKVNDKEEQDQPGDDTESKDDGKEKQDQPGDDEESKDDGKEEQDQPGNDEESKDDDKEEQDQPGDDTESKDDDKEEQEQPDGKEELDQPHHDEESKDDRKEEQQSHPNLEEQHKEPEGNPEPHTPNGNGVANTEIVSEPLPSPAQPVTPVTPVTPSAPVEKSKPAKKQVTFAKKDDCSLFVARAFKTLLPNLSVKRYLPVKEAVSEVISLIDSPEVMPKTIKMYNSTLQAEPLQVYTCILRTVSESGDPKMVSVALDCMQKMMSFGDITDGIEGTLPLIPFAKRAKMPMPPKVEEEDHPWKGKKVGLLSEMIYSIVGCASVGESVSLQILKGLLTGVTERQAHGWTLRMAVACIFQIAIKSTGPPHNATARTTLTQVINWVFQRMEEVSRDIAKGTPSSNPFKLDQEIHPGTKMTVHHSDASHVMSFICGITDTVEVTEYTPVEATEMRTLTSALELVQRLVASCGPGFKETPAFLESIKKPLLTTIVKCVVSPVPSIIQAALNIFYVLVVGFKHCMKHEIGMLLCNIVLKVLESNHASYDQRILVLGTLTKVVQTPQILVDIFVNYDCDVNEENVFEKMINCFSRFVMAPHVEVDWLSSKQDQTMRAVGLKTVVTVLQSFEAWIKKGKPTEPAAAPSRTVTLAVYADVEKQRKLKGVIEQVSLAFATKPKNGIALLISNGLADPSPASIARALDEYQAIDRGLVGEYLGDPQNVDVLAAWCQLNDFTNVSLDNAVKIFLQKISLPKEGQKVERILEYFAATFYEMNQGGVCRNEEAAFVLAVGIVMLNTDLHNPRIDNKMTKEKFKMQFRGVNNNQDFDATYLDDIYDNIQNYPMEDLQYMATMNVKDTSSESGGLFSAFTSKRDKKISAYATESQRLINMTSSIVNHTRKQTPYYQGTDIEHVKPMLSACWAALLACFSSHFEAEDPVPSANVSDVVKLCIDGLCKGVHVSSVFEMHTEREAYIRCLCSMTNAAEKRRLIGQKNILVIKALLKVPFVDGDLLYGSWLPYLRTASEVEHLRSMGARHKQRTSSDQHRQRRKSIADLSLDEQANAREVMLNIDEFSIHKIISHSTSHSQAGLKEFVTHLCTVAYEEVNMVNPRTFLLEKVVEVASDNMGARMLSIWKEMAHLFVSVGTHTNSDIAEYGVDNLRQLVSKGLGKQELSECLIQPELLEPFHGIMVSSLPTKQVRDLVLRCLLQLVQAKAKLIGPGWPVILKALVSGITRHKEPFALDMTATIMTTLISEENIRNMLPYVEEVVHCLTFIASDTKLLPEKSIKFADILGEFPVRVTESQADEETCRQAWEWVFEGFSFLFLDPDVTVRQRCVASLSKSLRSKTIPAGVWESWSTKFIVAVTLRPLSHVQLNKAEAYSHCRHHNVTGKIERANPKEWADTTLPEIISKLIVQPAAVHCDSREFVQCVPSLVAVLCKIAKRKNMRQVHVVMKQLAELLEAVTPTMTRGEWCPVILHLRSLFKYSILRTTPLQPFATDKTIVFSDPINDGTFFPTMLELCPDEYKAALAAHPGSPGMGTGKAVAAPLVARSSSSSMLKQAQQEDNDMWVHLLYGQEEASSEGSYYETESVLLEDLSMRCARQAGLVSILETLMLGGEFEWVNEASLDFNDFKGIHDCVKFCAQTASVFFSPALQEWRGKLSKEYPDIVRRRRSQALLLNTGILFKAYNATGAGLRELARSHLLTDSLELLEIYQAQPEPCLEPALVAIVKQLLGLPAVDFETISKDFYKPLISIIPVESSQEVRVALHDFLSAFYPGKQ